MKTLLTIIALCFGFSSYVAYAASTDKNSTDKNPATPKVAQQQEETPSTQATGDEEEKKEEDASKK